MTPLERTLSRVRRGALILSLAPVLARWAGLGLLGVSAVELFFAWAPLGGQTTVTAGVCVLAMAGLVRDWAAALRSARWDNLARKWGVIPTDLFITAGQLAADDKKTDFHERALQQARSMFPRFWVRRMWETRWGWDYLLCFVAVAVGWAVFYGGGLTPRRVVEVVPGDAVFARGSDVAISVRFTGTKERAVQLEVKGNGGKWENRPLVLSPDGRSGIVLKALRDPLKYRVREGFFRSKTFQLTPFDPPQLVELIAEVTPPAYMDKKTETIKNLLVFKVWAGSRVRWRLSLTPADALLRIADGTVFNKTKDGWTWDEKVDRPVRRSIWAAKGRESETAVAELAVDVETDQPPVLVLAGPSENMAADLHDQIPITAEATDDIGLARLDFVWRVNGGAWVRQQWEEFVRGTREKWIERVWDLGPLLLNPGEQVDFFLEAQDRQTPAGRGRTPTRSVRVSDVRLDQQQLQAELEEFHRAFARRVDEQQSVLADLRGRAAQENVAVSTPNWPALLTNQRQTARRFSGDVRRLENLLDRMDTAESFDADTLIQHHAMAEGLSDAEQFDLPEIDQALAAADKQRAENAMEDLGRRLEAMQKMAADSMRQHQTRGLLREQGDLKNRVENLARSLPGAGALSPDQQERFQKTVEALQAAVKRIQEKMEKLTLQSEELDEKAPKEILRFDRVSSALARLGGALSRADGAEALSAAKDALAELEEIERQLAQGGAGAMGTSGGEDAENDEALKRAIEKVKDLADRQEGLYGQTVSVVDSRRAVRAARQKETLDSLRNVVPRWQSALQKQDHSFLVSDQVPHPPLRGTFPQEGKENNEFPSPLGRPVAELPAPGAAEPLMRGQGEGVEQGPFLEMTVSEIQRALAAGDGPSAYKGLRQLQTGVDLLIAKEGPNGSPSVLGDLATEVHGMIDRLDQKEVPMDQGEKDSLRQRAKEQEILAEETRRLSEHLWVLALESGAVSPRVGRNVNDAAEAMIRAGVSLGNAEPEPASAFQSTALERLRDAESKLNETSKDRSSFSKNGGRGRSGRTSLRLGGQRNAEPIPLPKKEDFRSPGTFRQEIIDGMKEPVPVDQQPAVQDYYRHWTK